MSGGGEEAARRRIEPVRCARLCSQRATAKWLGAGTEVEVLRGVETTATYPPMDPKRLVAAPPSPRRTPCREIDGERESKGAGGREGEGAGGGAVGPGACVERAAKSGGVVRERRRWESQRATTRARAAKGRKDAGYGRAHTTNSLGAGSRRPRAVDLDVGNSCQRAPTQRDEPGARVDHQLDSERRLPTPVEG